MKKVLIVIGVLALILAACGSTSTSTPIPTVVLDAGGTDEATSPQRGSVIASGVILPAQEANLAFTIGGNVQTIHAAVGDKVKAGDVLAELDSTLARLDVEQAKRTLRELTSPASIAAAERATAFAEKNVEDAQNKVYALDYPRASDTKIKNIRSDLETAKKQLALASDAYHRIAKLSDGDNRKSRALDVLTAAEFRVRQLQAEYDWYTGKPTETDAAIAHANLEAAKAALNEAQWYLAALKGEQVPPEATGAQLTQLQQARDALEAAQRRFDNTHLIAPFSGVIAVVNIIQGEFASPGQTIAVVSNMDQFHVETTDLSERQITQVRIGDSASIRVDALNQEFGGRVVNISPMANTLGGDVVYKVTIAFDEKVEGLLSGMSATVEIHVGK